MLQHKKFVCKSYNALKLNVSINCSKINANNSYVIELLICLTIKIIYTINS